MRSDEHVCDTEAPEEHRKPVVTDTWEMAKMAAESMSSLKEEAYGFKTEPTYKSEPCHKRERSFVMPKQEGVSGKTKYPISFYR